MITCPTVKAYLGKSDIYFAFDFNTVDSIFFFYQWLYPLNKNQAVTQLHYNLTIH